MSKFADQFFAKANATPTAYGYARVSHATSFAKGDSIESQYERIETYYESNLKKDGVTWGGIQDDGTNISAYKIPFHARPAGRELITLLEPGDHLILDKVDRIWRSIEDFISLMKTFRERNINIHIVSFLGSSIQNNTPMGEFILRLFVLIAELESTIKSERIKEALNKQKATGKLINHVPPGCEVTTKEVYGETVKFLVWSPKTRTFMQKIVSIIDDHETNWDDAIHQIDHAYYMLGIDDPRPMPLLSDVYKKKAYQNYYQHEAAYQYLGITDPANIPKKEIIKEAARQHKRERTNRRIKENPNRYSIKISRRPVITPQQLLSME